MNAWDGLISLIYSPMDGAASPLLIDSLNSWIWSLKCGVAASSVIDIMCAYHLVANAVHKAAFLTQRSQLSLQSYADK